MTKLTIVANIYANPESADIVKAELIKLIHITRQEQGCINYDLHIDNENPTHFMFYENWESRELWQLHMDAQHIQDYMVATEGLVEHFTLHEMSNID